MLLRRAAAVVAHHTTAKISPIFFSTATPYSRIPKELRPKVIQETQDALREYLQKTRSVPFIYADHISKNSPLSLSELLSRMSFTLTRFTVAASFHRYRRYDIIDELEFLSESIGLNCKRKGNIFPHGAFFISDWKHFDGLCALAGMGFPWRKLGLLCREGSSIFYADPSQVERRMEELKDYGFNGVTVISIGLAFPHVLCRNADGFLTHLKILLLDYGLLSSVEESVDAVLELCEKIRLFYDLGCEMGKVRELMGRSKSIFIEYSKEHLMGKIEYFCKLNVPRDEVGLFLLSRTEFFGFDLGGQVISVSGFLAHLGMEEEELKSLELKYPYVFGRNRLANVPCVMRAMDVGEWFFKRLQHGDPSLLTSYTMSSSEDLDEHYEEGLRKLEAKITRAYAKTKLDFVHSLGFGENRFAIKTSIELRSSSSKLQERIDVLLGCGIEYSKLLAMLKFYPKILSQEPEKLERKIEYLRTEIGASPQSLYKFPGYLCYNLERRIRPRYRLYKELKEEGRCKKTYSVYTIVASSGRTFIKMVYGMDHAAPKACQEILLK